MVLLLEAGQRGLIFSIGKMSCMLILLYACACLCLHIILDFISYMSRWLLATFTERYDYVLDVFAGCGGLGKASGEDMRHCQCLEIDDVLYGGCLSTMACGPVPC